MSRAGYPNLPYFPHTQLAEVQRLVVESQSLREKLCALEKELTQVMDSAEEEEWNSLVQQADEVKVW